MDTVRDCSLPSPKSQYYYSLPLVLYYLNPKCPLQAYVYVSSWVTLLEIGGKMKWGLNVGNESLVSCLSKFNLVPGPRFLSFLVTVS